MSEKDKMKKLAGIGDNKSPLSVIEIINKYDYLSKAFKYIVENNDSNYAPYHNINHLLTVTKYVYYALEFEELLEQENDVKNMLIAAIFHDFNHSAGKKKDAANIADAKAGIKEFVEKEDIKVDIDFIDKVLDAPEYPYAIESKDLNEFQAIIRDADLTQVFESNWIYQNIFGLSKELNMTPVEFMKGQRKFLESVKFNTAYGEYLAKEKWPQVMKEFEALENIIK
jgi:hypothetical protein